MSAVVSATTLDGGNLAAPTGLTVTVTSTTIEASWNAVPGATGYNFYVSADNFTTYESEQTTVTSYTESFTPAEVPAGTTLYFRVSAYNTYGEGAKSDIVSRTIPGGGNNLSLDGVWSIGTMNVTINGNSGVFTILPTDNALWQDAVSKGYINVGDQHFRNLTKTSDLTWTGQVLKVQYYPSSPNVAIGTTWGNCTITMNANGQTFTEGGDTWTRVNTSLNGVWSIGTMTVTINGSTGVFTILPTDNALWQDAVNKGYINVGDQHFRNLTKTGDLTWTGQVLKVQYYPSSPNVATGTTWANCTITINANGQTFIEGGDTWTRQ
jgi:TM2 domain-containing membrane protein YozV